MRRITSCTRMGNTRARGQGIIELVAALVCITPFILLLIDCGMLAIGAGLNDQVCKDAARAAASGPPGESIVGLNRPVGPGKIPHDRALSVIKRVYATNMPMKVRDTIVASESVRVVPPSLVGGAIDGDITVQTTMDVYPPFLVGAIVGPGGISLKSSHKVPFTYVVPNTTAEAP